MSEADNTTSNMLDDLDRHLREFAEKLIKTADELQRGEIHPAHAANRLRKMARGIKGEAR